MSTNYRGVDLVEVPPNGQGLTALVMLNILENFDIKSLDPIGSERFHLVLEAERIAYAVRDTHLADADHMRTPVAALNDRSWGKNLALLIDLNRRSALPAAPAPGSNTVYLAVVDRDRTAVSFVNSLYSSFGSGICTAKSGVLSNDRGTCFTLAPDHPNTFGLAKRPMHTIMPALAMKNGRCDVSFGVVGGSYQPMGHVLIMLNMLDCGMDVHQAIDFPRFFWKTRW
ncbi:gamma-glutamyltransferase [Mesorhizobium sp. M0854]|uniref:gamma-glutamyltransferase n=1 Tax=Mesorhizobium sp. M0854 TaxID=2957013 RepID=UPI00333DC3F3